MLCSLNGLRPDDPQASLVVMRLLLAESGHSIFPLNKEDQLMTPEEQDSIFRLWQGRHGHTAACEQSNINSKNDVKIDETNYDIKPNDAQNFDNSEHIKQKLQFAADTESKDVIESEDMHKSDNKLKVADDEPAIQVLASDNLEEDYESPQDYAGDQFPAHLKTSKLRYLSKLYKAIPEEFYTRTQRAPATPRNARSWARKRKGAHFHFWEMRSGSGRLSFLALRAGLGVMDYRYGWDLASPSHRRLIDEIEETFKHHIDFTSPSYRPWSIPLCDETLNKPSENGKRKCL